MAPRTPSTLRPGGEAAARTVAPRGPSRGVDPFGTGAGVGAEAGAGAGAGARAGAGTGVGDGTASEVDA